jgi:hypothetical protein
VGDGRMTKKNKMTKEMKERVESVGGEWIDCGNGYYSMIGCGMFCVTAYVALPEGHPDIGKDFDDLDPDVNGGLTFGGGGNVFGWDYGHAFNQGSPEEHIKNALDYFKKRQK